MDDLDEELLKLRKRLEAVNESKAELTAQIEEIEDIVKIRNDAYVKGRSEREEEIKALQMVNIELRGMYDKLSETKFGN